jgi:hypothetical protein
VNKYKVLIHATNLWLEIDGDVQRQAFYTPRFVEAYTQDSAKKLALENFIAESKWQDVLGGLHNPPDQPPQLQVEEVEEIGTFEHVTNFYPGYALYEEDKEEI